MPSDCFTLAVRVSCQKDFIGRLGLLADLTNEVSLAADVDIVRFKFVLDIYAKRAFGQVAHVSKGRDDLVITAGEDKCSVSIREGFIDELRTSMTREILPCEVEDLETFRNAIQLLWSLADKGYQLADTVSIVAGQQPVFLPSIVDKLMRKDVAGNPKGRNSLITDENILNQLHR